MEKRKKIKKKNTEKNAERCKLKKKKVNTGKKIKKKNKKGGRNKKVKKNENFFGKPRNELYFRVRRHRRI